MQHHAAQPKNSLEVKCEPQILRLTFELIIPTRLLVHGHWSKVESNPGSLNRSFPS